MYIWEINSKYADNPKDFYTDEENEKLSREFRREMAEISEIDTNEEMQSNF